MSITIDKATILKFDVSGPRYTSYPTAPVWSDEVTEQVYIQRLKSFGQSDKTLSLNFNQEISRLINLFKFFLVFLIKVIIVYFYICLNCILCVMRNPVGMI